jgi:hypothetical protein
MSANHLVGRKAIAVALTAGLLVTATAVNAKPAETTTVAVVWTRSVPDLLTENGSVIIRQSADGTVTFDLDVSRVQSCPGGGQTVETWLGTTTQANLTVPNNLSTAAAAGDFTTLYSKVSDCEADTTYQIGQVLVDGVATDRTIRDRTVDHVRTLTRNASFTLTFGSDALLRAGTIEKRIG